MSGGGALRCAPSSRPDYGRGGCRYWKAPVESRPTNLWRYMTFPARSLTDPKTSVSIRDTLHFVAPIPPGKSLATARLAIEVEWVTLYKDYGETGVEYRLLRRSVDGAAASALSPASRSRCRVL